MAHVRLHDMTAEQVREFIKWFRDHGEDSFREHCQKQGLGLIPFVDCEHCPDLNKSGYDGSMEIEMYSLTPELIADPRANRNDRPK